MADHGLTESPLDEARAASAQIDEWLNNFDADDVAPEVIRTANALRELLRTTREDNAPESIAHEVIARRYGTYETFEIALRLDPEGLAPLGILNMLKDAAAAGLDSREEF